MQIALQAVGVSLREFRDRLERRDDGSGFSLSFVLARLSWSSQRPNPGTCIGMTACRTDRDVAGKSALRTVYQHNLAGQGWRDPSANPPAQSEAQIGQEAFRDCTGRRFVALCLRNGCARGGTLATGDHDSGTRTSDPGFDIPWTNARLVRFGDLCAGQWICSRLVCRHR
jgi:hypothetical protein